MHFVIDWIDCAAVSCRLNEAPVKGFEKDVGSKTTMRITYPEGAIQKTECYETQSLFVLSAFKALDFRWLRHMVFNQRLVRQLKTVLLLPLTTNLITILRLH